MTSARVASLSVLATALCAERRLHRHLRAHGDVGDPNCPCVGFDETGSSTTITFGDGETEYPNDLGSRCEAWDDGRNEKSCMKEDQDPGKGQGWCAQRWCYVDPCNCNLQVLPKVSFYMPEATKNGSTVFFSYAACGGSDGYTLEAKKTACVHQVLPETCRELADSCVWSGTRCITKAIAEECELDETPGYFQSEADCTEGDKDCQRFKFAQAGVLAAEKKLHTNIVETREKKKALSELKDKKAQESEIKEHEAAVAKEVQAPNLAKFLGNWWREMRGLRLPDYKVHVEKRLKDLKEAKPELENELTDAKTTLAEIRDLEADIDTYDGGKKGGDERIEAKAKAPEEDKNEDTEDEDTEEAKGGVQDTLHATRKQFKDFRSGRTGGGDRDGYYPVDLTGGGGSKDDDDEDDSTAASDEGAKSDENDSDSDNDDKDAPTVKPAPTSATETDSDDDDGKDANAVAAEAEEEADKAEASKKDDAADDDEDAADSGSVDATHQQFQDFVNGNTGGGKRNGYYPVDLTNPN